MFGRTSRTKRKKMEAVMQRDVISQVEREELIIRHTPRPWPRSTRRGPWQGPPPLGVAAIIKREDLDPDFSKLYAKWASTFALLTDEFIRLIVGAAGERTARPLEWSCYRLVECCSCKIRDNYLWVQKHESGWTIELCYPHPNDPDSFVLTVDHMPVLCPDAASAAWLAQACYPTPPANLTWDPYW
jgi:hypothetical protein